MKPEKFNDLLMVNDDLFISTEAITTIHFLYITFIIIIKIEFGFMPDLDSIYINNNKSIFDIFFLPHFCFSLFLFCFKPNFSNV